MRRMNSTQLHGGADTATIGGGTRQYEAVRALYEQGRKAAGMDTTLSEALFGEENI